MRPFAFVFPGQGSQAVGMLDAWGSDPVVSETVREASDAARLAHVLGLVGQVAGVRSVRRK